MRTIEVLDTTLRDGAQAAGISFFADDKIKIARLISRLGVTYIEGGIPAGNPKDAEFFGISEVRECRDAAYVAFGSTAKPGSSVEDDAGIRALAASRARTVSLCGKTSPLHVKRVLRADKAENLRVIKESAAYLCAAGIRVFFDAEHFFDAYREDSHYALNCLQAAAEGGACLLVLCDTNGGALPHQVNEATRAVLEAFSLPVGIHCHNDSGLAAANTLSAVQAGAGHIQGTVAGIGERCGNADLCTLLPLLQLKCGYRLIPEDALARITPLSRAVCDVMNLAPDTRAPFVGKAAFTHKAGMHIDGVLKAVESFEHIRPEAVGNKRRFPVSDQAGRAGVAQRLGRVLPGIGKDSREMHKVMRLLKDKEQRGFTYENADASFELMALEALGMRKSFFKVADYHVLSKQPQDAVNGVKSAAATVKVTVDNRQEINAAEGDGPVNALDEALRKTLSAFFPCLTKMRLKDFKVRVIDFGGTASTVRVSVESTDGVHDWNTVGVSKDIIQACFMALVDSLDYMLLFLADG